jgi:glycosyltransferase involved in cell wall biosynthesis
MFSSAGSVLGLEYVNQFPNVDVINVHWISLFIDWAAFSHPKLRPIPLVFTLHDMNAFTGGCHYSGPCAKFKEKCGACPQLGSRDDSDLSRRGWLRKAEGLSRRDPQSTVIVAICNWLQREASQSSLLAPFPILTIPYGLDTDDFAPRNRQLARATLGIPSDVKVILFVADDVSNPRKGFLALARALEKVPPKGRLLISLGKGRLTVPTEWEHKPLGHIQGDRLLSLVYSCADIFVIPSLEEALGQTPIEAMACGVPAIGFDVGGIPDIIGHDTTGFLVAKGDIEGLSCRIDQLLNDDMTRFKMGQECRKIAELKFSLATQARAYHKLYSSLTNPH